MEQFKAKGKLRNKIFLMMALAGIVPVLIAAIISIASLTKSHKIDVARLEDALIEQARVETENSINQLFSQFQIVTVHEETEDVSLQEKKFIFGTLLTNFSNLIEIIAVDLAGRAQIRFDKTYLEGTDTDLKDVEEAKGFLMAKSGVIYAEMMGFVNGEPEMKIYAPFFNKNKVVLSVMVVRVGLGRIAPILQAIPLGETGYLYLVDHVGRVIASGFGGPASSADMSHIRIVPAILNGESFVGIEGQMRYDNFYGEQVVAAGKFFGLGDVPELGLGLIAEWPAKEADAFVNQTYERDGIILLLVLAVVILFSILLSMFITRPIRALEQGAERVAAGKFDEGVEIYTGDELEELGFHFNKMMVGLQQLEELKNEFVFIAAHELRTPVAAMKGYLTLILDGVTGPVTDKTKDFIGKVINSNQRLIQLVNDLLEVSRSEGGKLTIKVTPIDIAEPVRGVFMELQSLADKAEVQLAYAPSSDLPKVMADSDRLKEVMVNLIGNSIKYMGPPSHDGSGEASGLDSTHSTSSGQAGQVVSRMVTISHEVKEKELVTHVTDTGLGMSKEAQTKLFEKFYRVQTEKTQSIQGTGLGLFIVKQIIEKMNGKIWVESEGEGKGSTFSFSLPTV